MKTLIRYADKIDNIKNNINKFLEGATDENIEEYKSQLINENVYNIRLIPEPLEEHYILAIKNDPRRDKIFKYNIPPEKQTENICIEAMKKSGLALCRVVKQTEEICLTAVQQNGLALKYVKNPTKRICLEAVKQNPHALKHIKNIDKELYLEALKASISSLSYLIDNYDELEELETELLQHLSSI